MDSQGFQPEVSIFPLSGRIMRPLGSWAISRTFAYQSLNVTSSSLCLDSYLFACSLSAAAGSGLLTAAERSERRSWFSNVQTQLDFLMRVPLGRHEKFAPEMFLPKGEKVESSRACTPNKNCGPKWVHACKTITCEQIR